MKLKMIICVVVIINCTSLIFAEKVYQSKYFEITKSVFTEYNENGLYETAEIFLNRLDLMLEKIVDALDVHDWREQYDENEKFIKLEYKDRSPSHIDGGYYGFRVRKLRIYFPELVKVGYAPFEREITHLLLLDYSSHTLCEGIASYVMLDICQNDRMFGFGYPVHLAVKELLLDEENAELLEYIGIEGVPSNRIIKNNRLRSNYYIFTHSFTKYLIEKYGIENVLFLYKSKTLYEDYKKILDKELYELIDDWLVHVNGLEEHPIRYQYWVGKEMEKLTYLIENVR